MTEGAAARGSARRLALLLALFAGFIVYGSLYPFAWRALPANADPLTLLLASAARWPAGRGDVLANLLLYLPFGLLLAAALPGRWPRIARILSPVLAGMLLSLAVETAQLWAVGRVSSLSDVALNTLGALAGAALAAFAVGRSPAGGVRLRLAEPVAGLLVLTWLAWHLFPYVPSIDWQAWKTNLKPLVNEPLLPLRAVQLTACWTSAALLAEAALGDGRRARWMVPAMLALALASEVLIAGQRLTRAEALAIGLALPLWLLLRGRGVAAPVMAAAMLAAVLIERLAPFDFSAAVPRPFGWIPFRSLVWGRLEVGYHSILLKLFLHGALLWWLVRSGLRLPLAAGLQAAVVLAASLAQTRIPGRSAEVTDALIVLALATAFHLARRPAGGDGSAAPQGSRA